MYIFIHFIGKSFFPLFLYFLKCWAGATTLFFLARRALSMIVVVFVSDRVTHMEFSWISSSFLLTCHGHRRHAVSQTRSTLRPILITLISQIATKKEAEIWQIYNIVRTYIAQLSSCAPSNNEVDS